MTDARYTTLPQWPNAYPASGGSALSTGTLTLIIDTRVPGAPGAAAPQALPAPAVKK
jgi:hypothetical protein